MTTAPNGRTLPAFVDGRGLRLALGTLLYLAQGFPQGIIFSALPAWLAVSGADASSVAAVIAAASIPWTFKFLLGAFVERYTYLAMGRRRSWIILAQILIALSFVFFALASPDPTQVDLIIGFTLVLSTCTALQDVALDAMVVDLVPAEEMGRINGFMYGGKAFGMAGGGAMTGFFLEYYSIEVAMIAALCFFAVPAVSILLVRERPGEKLFPWTTGGASQQSIDARVGAWLPMLKIAFRNLMHRDVILVASFMFFLGFTQVFLTTTESLFASRQLGWGETRITSVVGILNIVSGLLTLVAGGIAADRLGPKKLALVFGSLVIVLLSVALNRDDLWTSDVAFTIYMVLNYSTYVMVYLAMLVVAMRVTDTRTAAINFNILTGAFAGGLVVGGPLVGVVDEMAGFHGLILVPAISLAVALCFAAAWSREVGGPATDAPAGNAASQR